MRMSQLFGKTLRQDPGEAEMASHRLMLRAGMVQPLVSGVYSLLPLGLRAYRKIEGIIREEMDRAGAQELLMPAMQPIELWEQSGRRAAFGPTLITFTDRNERWLCLAPTHEEVVTSLVARNVQSYRDLPLTLYQVQTKFRDEPRPRAGLIRVREFAMKDAYSFDTDAAGLDVSYQKMFDAYTRIFQRCGLNARPVEADSGAIGGKDSVEFMLLADSGEDHVIFCKSCGYAANAEKAVFEKPKVLPEPPLQLQEVATPGKKTIEEVSAFLGVPKSKTIKAVLYVADKQLIFVSIRGDLQVNEVKLKNALKATDLRLATDEEVRAAGIVAGYASPIGLKGVRTVADDSAQQAPNAVVGANKEHAHLKHANYGRDFTADVVVDVALAEAGFTCAKCHSPMASANGIEVGHIFKLGTKYSEAFHAAFLDKDGVQRVAVMGCYGIGVGRLLAAAIEQNHDDKGIVWPAPIAPYQAHLVGLNIDNAAVATACQELYQRLQDAGIEVLFDDRSESPGVKFNDADLLGLPLRVTVSPRTLKQSSAELKRRAEQGFTLVPLQGAVMAVQEALSLASR